MDNRYEKFSKETKEQAMAMLYHYPKEKVLKFLASQTAEETIRDEFESALYYVERGTWTPEMILNYGPSAAAYCLYMMYN